MTESSGAAPAPRFRRELGVLGLVFLSSGLGMFLFGAVRLWSIGPLSLLVFAALTMWGWHLRRDETVLDLPLPPALVPTLVFLGYAAILIGWIPPHYPARVKWLMMCTAPAAYFLWTAMVGPRWRWRFWWCALLLLITVVGWYAVVQHIRGDRAVLNLIRPEGYGMRASGTYFCPNHFAHMVVVGICAGVAIAAAPRAGAAARLIGGYAALFLLYPLFLTRSRAALLGLGAGVAAFALLLAARRGWRRVFLVLPVLLVAVIGSGAALWKFSPVWRARFEEAVQGIRTGLDFRPLCWKGTLEMIRQRPFFGWGGGSYAWTEPAFQLYPADRTAVHAHNEPLHLVAEYGLVGGSLIAILAIVWLWRAIQLTLRAPSPRNAVLTAGAIAVFIATCVHGLFDFNVHIYSNSHAVLLFMGIAMGLHARAGGLPRMALPRPKRRVLGGLLAAVGAALFLAMLATGVSYGIVFLGDAARDRRQDDSAEHWYRWAARIDPGNFNAWRELGWNHRHRATAAKTIDERKRWATSALALFRRAERINPYDEDTLLGLADAHRLLGDEEAAYQAFQRLVQIHPKRPHFWKLYAFQLERLGREADALEAFQKARALGDRGRDVSWKIRLLTQRLKPQDVSTPTR